MGKTCDVCGAKALKFRTVDAGMRVGGKADLCLFCFENLEAAMAGGRHWEIAGRIANYMERRMVKTLGLHAFEIEDGRQVTCAVCGGPHMHYRHFAPGDPPAESISVDTAESREFEPAEDGTMTEPEEPSCCPTRYGDRINEALSWAERFGQGDGDDHRLWVIDQMVRSLTGSVAAYEQWVSDHCQDGEYAWETGSAP